MKKFIVACAIFVFAWWFVVVSGSYQSTRVETIGPFHTEEQCKNIASSVKSQHKQSPQFGSGQIIGFVSDCWSDRTEAREDPTNWQ